MKGIAAILMLIGLLAVSYLVVQDLKARKEQGTANIEAIEKASRTEKKVEKAYEAQQNRIKDLVGE